MGHCIKLPISHVIQKLFTMHYRNIKIMTEISRVFNEKVFSSQSQAQIFWFGSNYHFQLTIFKFLWRWIGKIFTFLDISEQTFTSFDLSSNLIYFWTENFEKVLFSIHKVRNNTQLDSISLLAWIFNYLYTLKIFQCSLNFTFNLIFTSTHFFLTAQTLLS